MSTDREPYHPPFWYRGRHLQTLWGPLFRHRRRPPVRRERLETPDGDFLDLDWLEGTPPAAPLVLVLHGLEGSSRSHYARGLLIAAGRLGWRSAVLHFRSCSGEVNRLARLYHSGETSDLEWVVARLREREGAGPIGLIGISLGGNVLLKWLGERGDAAPTEAAAVAISTPFDLAACARVLDRGFNRAVYTMSFLRTMKAKIRVKRALYDGDIDLSAVLRSRTFREYDRFFTAPLHGFADEQDYWARASSGPYLQRIRRPTLLINAANDPFMPAESLPRAAVERSPWLEAEFVTQGGHVGFLDGALGGSSWAERRALAFLRRHLLR